MEREAALRTIVRMLQQIPQDRLALLPWYSDTKRQITRPDRSIPVSDYFLEKWLPRLGPDRTCLILLLRMRCARATGEVLIRQSELAAMLGITDRTLRKILSDPDMSRFVRRRRRYERGPDGSVRRAPDVYEVVMDDPLVPEDEPLHVQLLAERILDPVELPASAKPDGGGPSPEEVPAERLVPEKLSGTARVAEINSDTGGVSEKISAEPEWSPQDRTGAPVPEKLSALISCVCVEESTPSQTAHSSRPDPEIDALLRRMEEVGVSRRAGIRLIEEAGPGEVRRQLEYLPFRGARDPAAMLVRSVKERWQPPPGFRPSSGSSGSSADRRKPADDLLERLDEEQRKAVVEQARREAGEAWTGPGDVPEALVRIRARMLAAKLLGGPTESSG